MIDPQQLGLPVQWKNDLEPPTVAQVEKKEEDYCIEAAMRLTENQEAKLAVGGTKSFVFTWKQELFRGEMHNFQLQNTSIMFYIILVCLKLYLHSGEDETILFGLGHHEVLLPSSRARCGQMGTRQSHQVSLGHNGTSLEKKLPDQVFLSWEVASPNFWIA